MKKSNALRKFKRDLDELGATTCLKFSEDHTVFQYLDNGKKVTKKVLLVKKTPKDLKMLGSVYGSGLAYCFYLGMKFCKNFKNRVCAYKVMPGGIRDCALSVTFYEKK